MRKIFPGTFLLVVILACSLPAAARVDVNISISVPPPIAFAAPPQMVVIPETYVYAVPEMDVDIFFYEGWWWRTWESHWYRSRSYDSGWVYYESEPVFYRDVPREWRRWYHERRWRDYRWDHRPIPYQEVRRNWRDWEENRYWERETTWYVDGLQRSESVHVDVSVAAPPPVTFHRPPQLVVIPETYVYAVPSIDIDIYFFDGWWWRSWEDRWYRSRSYSSGWVYYQHVPVFYRDIPREWRRFYRERRWRDHDWDYHPVPYREVERNWQSWERNRYWEKEKKWNIRVKSPKGSRKSYDAVYPAAPQYRQVGGPPVHKVYRQSAPPVQKIYRQTGPPAHNGGKSPSAGKPPKGKPDKGHGNGNGKGNGNKGHGNGKGNKH